METTQEAIVKRFGRGGMHVTLSTKKFREGMEVVVMTKEAEENEPCTA